MKEKENMSPPVDGHGNCYLLSSRKGNIRIKIDSNLFLRDRIKNFRLEFQQTSILFSGNVSKMMRTIVYRACEDQPRDRQSW